MLQPVDDLLVADGPPAYQPKALPTVDQDIPVATYEDWTPEQTRIVNYRIANNYYPGEYAETRDKAYAMATVKYGRILEANYVPGRAFFRVFRQRPVRTQ